MPRTVSSPGPKPQFLRPTIFPEGTVCTYRQSISPLPVVSNGPARRKLAPDGLFSNDGVRSQVPWLRVVIGCPGSARLVHARGRIET